VWQRDRFVALFGAIGLLAPAGLFYIEATE
jgi:hypothetical protein